MNSFGAPHSGQVRRSNWLLFWLGTFGLTQVFAFVGIVGISEIPVLLFAPFIGARDWGVLKQEGYSFFLKFIFFLMIATVVSSVFNHNLQWFVLLKVELLFYSIFAFVVVFHRLLRNNIPGIRWLLLGLFISLIIKVFAFDPTITTSASGSLAIEDGVGIASVDGPLFWLTRLAALGRAISGGWYLSVPIPVTAIYFLGTTAFVATRTVSGRSALATLLAGVLLQVLGRKSHASIKTFSKYFVFIIPVLALAGGLIKGTYSYAASHGYMGEEAQTKYEMQTAKGSSLLKILMAGRIEFFVCARALLDQPLMGFGASPYTSQPYYEDFLYQYGTTEEIQRYQLAVTRRGNTRGRLPLHSFVWSFWAYCGLPGVLFWLYVLWLILRYMTRYAPAVPRLFGYLALMTPLMVWDILFSPYTQRFTFPLYITCILLVKSVYQRRLYVDPYEAGLIKK